MLNKYLLINYFCTSIDHQFLLISLICALVANKVLGKVIDIRLKSPGWIRSLEEEMSVERICGSIPTSASSTLLSEDADMGEDDYDMEGQEQRAILTRENGEEVNASL